MNYWIIPQLEIRKKPVELIIDRVCEHFEISKTKLTSSTRKQEIVKAREIVAYILRVEYKMTLQSVGDILNRNHSSIIHIVKGAEFYIERDNKLKELIKSFL